MVYVANYNNNSISVINASKENNEVVWKVIWNIPVGKAPVSIAVDASSDTVYVANQDDKSVSVVNITNIVYKNNTSDDDNIQTVKVKGPPVSIAINQKTHMVYVANFYDNSISIIDGNKPKKNVTDMIQVGLHPSSLAVNQGENLLYVSNEGSNSISAIDMNTWFTKIYEIKVNGQVNVNDRCTSNVNVTDEYSPSGYKSIPKENGPNLRIINTSASGYVRGEEPVKAIDKDNTSNWSSFGSSWIQTDLSNNSRICSLQIAWSHNQTIPARSPISLQLLLLMSVIIIILNQLILDLLIVKKNNPMTEITILLDFRALLPNISRLT